MWGIKQPNITERTINVNYLGFIREKKAPPRPVTLILCPFSVPILVKYHLENVINFISSNGVRWIAIKMDTRGSIVYDTKQNKEYRIPVFPSETVDTTGAGDAYSGGFLEGIAETGNVLEAGIRGTVSASFAVEGWGAFGLLKVAKEEVRRRKNWLQNQVDL
jgi:hypothetical protein